MSSNKSKPNGSVPPIVRKVEARLIPSEDTTLEIIYNGYGSKSDSAEKA